MPHLTDIEIKLAVRAGYRHTRDVQIGDSFVLFNHQNRGPRHVWPIIERVNLTVRWQTADVIDGYFCHHKSYRFFTDAIERAAN